MISYRQTDGQTLLDVKSLSRLKRQIIDFFLNVSIKLIKHLNLS